MSEKINALKLDEKDNVAVVLETLKVGESIYVQDETKRISVSKTISYGHKVALDLIREGQEVIKYGECMGIATKDITIGDHVHVSNVRGLSDQDENVQKKVSNLENI